MKCMMKMQDIHNDSEKVVRYARSGAFGLNGDAKGISYV